MREETRKTLKVVGILWIIVAFAFVVAASLPIYGFLQYDIIINILIIFLTLIFVVLPGLVIIIITHPRFKELTKVKKIISWFIISLVLIITGVFIINELTIIFLWLPISAIYFALWLIPAKYPSIKPLFISVSLGFSAFIIITIILLVWLSSGIKPNSADLSGIAFFAFTAGTFIITTILSIIIGIILSIRKRKK